MVFGFIGGNPRERVNIKDATLFKSNNRKVLKGSVAKVAKKGSGFYIKPWRFNIQFESKLSRIGV